MKAKFNCPAQMTASLIGGKWKVIALWLLRKGPQRSGKLRARMLGISPAAFSLTVRELEESGLLRRIVREGRPPQVSYALSARGESLSPIVKSMVKWGLANQSHYVIGEYGMAGIYSGKR